jgi:hypothetical protein
MLHLYVALAEKERKVSQRKVIGLVLGLTAVFFDEGSERNRSIAGFCEKSLCPRCRWANVWPTPRSKTCPRITLDRPAGDRPGLRLGLQAARDTLATRQELANSAKQR